MPKQTKPAKRSKFFEANRWEIENPPSTDQIFHACQMALGQAENGVNKTSRQLAAMCRKHWG